MPSGLYKHTEEHNRAISKGLLRSSKAQKASRENAYNAGLSNKGRPKTQKQIESARENQKIAVKIAASLPRSEKQLESSREKGRKIGSLPRTQNQIEACRKTGKLPKTKVQIESARRKNRINANTIVEHHNDLCHGAERPEDVDCITLSEHGKLHANLRVENGTHHLLTKNREA